MSQPPSTITGATGSTLGDSARKAAAEAARRIQERWRRSGECDLPTAVAEHPVVLQHRTVFLDLVQQEYKSLRDEWRDRSPSAYCGRFSGLNRDLHSSLFRLIEVEQYLDAVPELSGFDAGINWPKPGTRFAEFEVDEEIGRGAVGRVFRCRQTPLGFREIILKVTRFPAAEAENLGRLDHPSVVPVYSTGTDAATGLGWICMPYVTRRTLADLIPTDPSLTPPARLGTDETLRMFWALADALDHVQRRGMLHGDLKPSNVLAPEKGPPMLIDFNLAVYAGRDADPAGGTPRYMAPEQLLTLERSAGRGVGPASAATEAFSFAVVLAEVLLGRPPFDSAPGCGGLEEAARSLLCSHADNTIGVVARLRKIDAGVADLVSRCLSEEPRRRPKDFAEIRDSLGGCLRPHARLRRFALSKPHSTSVAGLAAVALAVFASTQLYDATRVDADTWRLRGEINLASDDFVGAASQYLEAWRDAESPHDLAMAAYCRNLGGDHKAAANLYVLAIDAGLSHPVVDANYAASLLSSMQNAYDDQKSWLVERSLLRAFEAAPENETVRMHMLRHYLLAVEKPSRQRPEYPVEIASLPEDGASEGFCALALQFLALQTSDHSVLALIGLPLLERIAAQHGASAVEGQVGRDTWKAYESIDGLDRIAESSKTPGPPPPVFLNPEKLSLR